MINWEPRDHMRRHDERHSNAIGGILLGAAICIVLVWIPLITWIWGK